MSNLAMISIELHSTVRSDDYIITKKIFGINLSHSEKQMMATTYNSRTLNNVRHTLIYMTDIQY